MKEIRLDLVVDGKKRTYTQSHVPLRKMIEAIEIMEKLEKDEYENSVDFVEEKIRFVADCFEDEEVTPEAILEGLNVWEFQQVQDVIDITLGIDPKEQAEKS